MKIKKNISKSKKEILNNLPLIFKQIRPGLSDGKCIFKDGLMNLTQNQLESIDFLECIVLLCIYIQAHPSDQLEYEEGEMLRMCNFLKMGIFICVLQKIGFVRFEYGFNKIYLDRDFKIIADEIIFKEFENEVINRN